MDCKPLINTKNGSLQETISTIRTIYHKIIKLNPSSIQNQQHKNLAPLNLKNFKPYFNENHTFEENKTQRKRNSMQLNLFRPNSASKEDQIKQYINMKNIKLIKQNIQKLEQKLPNPQFLLRKSNKKIISYNNFSLNNEQKSLQKIKRRSQSQQEVFLFKIQNLQHCRKLSHRFDRSKYFKCETEKNTRSNRQRGKQKTQPKLNQMKQSENKPKNIKNYVFFDEIIPVVRQRSCKPKTAGGFLKKYSVEHQFLIQDLQEQCRKTEQN